MECFVPQYLRKEIDLLHKYKPQLRNHCRQIAEFAFPIANQRIVSNCYSSYHGVQLDASGYDQPKQIVIKNLNMLMDEHHYIKNNPTFYYDMYEFMYDAAQCSRNETLNAVTMWVDSKKEKDPEIFTLLQLAYLADAKELFLADMEMDVDEGEDEE